MKIYIALYRAPIDAVNSMGTPTPEQMAKGMEMWMNWAKRCGDRLADLGAPLGGAERVHPDGTSEPGDMTITGYSILRAENFEEARALIDGHPHLGWNPACTIELIEKRPMPGMPE